MITKDYLEEQLTNLKAQQEQLLAEANAASGAIQFIKHLLSLDENSLNTEQLEALVGGKLQSIEEVPNEKEKEIKVKKE